MYTFILLIAIISHTSSDPRSPKIYNVLISSKKNLAPSQALPVYEPVLRTTSLGYAYSPFVYTHFGNLPPATTYIQQPADDVHNIRQASGTIYQTQPSIPENRYLQQDSLPALPEVARSNQLSTTNPQSDNPYPQQRLVSTLQEESDPNQLPQEHQQRPNLYMQPLDNNINGGSQQANAVYQTQQSISQNSNMEKKNGVKSLPNNVVPLEYNVPYYTPLSYHQYFPRIEALHVQPQAVSIQSHPVPIQQQIVSVQQQDLPIQSQTVPIQSQTVPIQSPTVPIQSQTVPRQSQELEPIVYRRPESVPLEKAANGKRPPIPPQPITYERLFGDNQPADPKQTIANFKRNPSIADVPPPPLPIKSS